MTLEKQSLVVVLCALCLSASVWAGIGEYYVQSVTNPVSCPTDTCLTLAEYASNQSVYFTSDTTFILSPGEHYLNEPLVLKNVSSITIHGDGGQSSIILSSDAEIVWRFSSQIEVRSLKVTIHGQRTNSSLSFEQSQSIQIFNVTFSRVENTMSYSRALDFAGTEFVDITNCSFLNCLSQSGGAIRAHSSSLTFSGENFFTNNTAEMSGGAIQALNSSLVFTGANTFTGNRGRTNRQETTIIDPAAGGGAIMLSNSVAEMSNLTVFSNNGAVNDDFLGGGGIHSHNSVLTIRDRAIFSRNGGTFAGAIKGYKSTITLQGQVTFEENRQAGVISVFNSNFSFTGEMNCSFNQILINHGFGACLYSENSTIYITGDINFINNTARNGVGGAFFAFNSTTYFDGNINFINNSANGIGGGLSVDRSFVELRGHINFISNSAVHRGGGMYAIDSTVTFSGSGNFVGNEAMEGGGMGLEGDAWLELNPPVMVTFDRNRAETIGAALLFQDASTIAQCQNISVELETCFFRVNTENGSKNVSNMDTLYLNFTRNVAGAAGTVLYGGALQLCRVWVDSSPVGRDVNSFSFFKDISIFDLDDGDTSPITSDPLKVCFCYNGVPDCNVEYSKNISISRGALFEMSVVTVGQGDYPVPSTLRAYIRNNDNTTELTPQSHEIGQTCTDIGFRLLSENADKTVVLYPGGPCGNTFSTHRLVQVELGKCPPGFTQLENRGRCICEERFLALNESNECDIDTGLVRRPGNTWLKPQFDENGTYLGFVLNRNCPFSYCRPEEETIMLNLSSPNSSDSVCAPNRMGTLCGSCTSNFSLVLSNYNCRVCDNSYLALLIFFVVGGIALIAFLLILQMTVASGTINGLILYANIVNINSLIFIPNQYDSNNPLVVFIAWLNLDLGISTCFYDGLDFYAYAWLEYAFPVYLWTLIGIITIVSNRSTRIRYLFGTNPIAVLATVILMSFTKLMKAVIITLAYTDLEHPDGSYEKVWLFDATVPYFEGKHIALTIVALLVIFVLLIPYILLLLFGYRLQAYSGKTSFHWFNKFKPLLDAYYAPYSKNTRYWTGCMLLTRSGLYLIFAFNTLSNSSANLITISSVFTAIAIIPWLSHRIYNKYYLDLLEASFILNICILSTATYHVQATGGNQAVVAFISIGVAFAEFLGIIIFHIYLQVRKRRVHMVYKNVRGKLEGVGERIRFWQRKQGLEVEGEGSNTVPRNPTITVVELRESLLEEEL